MEFLWKVWATTMSGFIDLGRLGTMWGHNFGVMSLGGICFKLLNVAGCTKLSAIVGLCFSPTLPNHMVTLHAML